jgi:hypothetical protein
MAAASPGGAPEGDFWGITSYFNPAGYVRRRANYRRFRDRLGIPLVTVELSFTERSNSAPVTPRF